MTFRTCAFLPAAAMCLTLIGCGANISSSSGSLTGHQLRGMVHGGQQPVIGATIQLYAAGSTGYGSGATALLNSPVTSDGSGSFSITGDYTCPSASSQLYIVATGGNPGLGPSTSNGALAMMAALGPCSLHGGQYTLDPNSFISINEVTTVAAVYALRGFMSAGSTAVGTSATNATGLANAFALVNNLVDLSSGAALTTTPAGNGTAPQAALNTLADILAPCVNSDGTAACTSLFTAATPSGGPTPTDTVQAVYNISSNPINNVSALYGLVPAAAPFQPTLSSAPNDWTLGVAYTTVALSSNGGGGASQTAIAIDGLGDVWIANEFTNATNLTSSVSELSSNGSILSGPAGYTGGGLNRPNYIAIDPTGNVWLTNSQVLSAVLIKFSGSGTPLSGPTGFSNVLTNGPLAIDGNGYVWCPLAKVDSNGNLVPGSPYTGGGTGVFVPGVSIDNSGNVWTAGYNPSGGSSYGVISEFSNSGTPLSGSGFTATGLLTPWSIANDHAGNAWVTNNNPFPKYGVAKFASDGTVLSGQGYTGGGLANPLGIAIDGAGKVWVTSDSYSGGTEYNSVVELDDSGNILSGASGFYLSSLSYPVGDAVDGSGNVWIVMAGTNVIEVVGAATPVVTPLSVGVKNGTLGSRP
jgi:hypothetical protein